MTQLLLTIIAARRKKTRGCLSEGTRAGAFTAEVRSVLMNNALVMDGNTGLLKQHKQPDGILTKAPQGVLRYINDTNIFFKTQF